MSGDTYAAPRNYHGLDHYYYHELYQDELDDNDSEASDTDTFAGVDQMLNGESSTQHALFEVELDDWSQPIPSCRLEKYRHWERSHACRMLRYARRYFEALKKLDWLYCGQIVMETNDGMRPSAKQITKRLGGGRTTLDSIFGCGLWKDERD
jgi:hypothetical protein